MNSANSTSNIATNTEPKIRWNQMGNEEKSTSFHQEIRRMNQLPATSSYVSHRLRVLNKILQLCPFRGPAHKIRNWSWFLLGCICD
ncbi:hypothetical protein OIU78_025178 [Salix suchowensis]|nr:hypothetical protein OIU78_025178 [Salix suchowensis]